MADVNFVVKNGLVVNTSFTANSTLVASPSINVNGQTNTSTLYVTISANVGTTTVANSAGVFTSTINAASVNAGAFTVGSSTVANSTGIYSSLVNASSFSVGSSTIANSTGIYSGVVNATSLIVGTSTIANSTGLYTGTVNATSLNVGTSAIVNTSGVYTSGAVNAVSFSLGSFTNSFSANTSKIVLGAGMGFQANGSTGTAGQALTSNGNAVYWANVTSIAGTNTQVQYNDNGFANAAAGFTFIKSTNTVFVAGSLGVGTAGSGVVGEIRAVDNVTAYYSSDRSLKDNIIIIPDSLTKVNQINGVYFDWNDKYIAERGGADGYFIRKHDIGVIAQEIEAVLPEAVGTRSNGIKAVNYEKIIPLLIEAIKELSAEIEKLKNN